ncbi:MAG TPA: sensor histidine kinase [Amycolatopsis sp.]|nr:sensor histidine kinase [Amycolatopsis sp.]
MSPTVSAVEPFAHPALFYRDDAEYLAGTVPFVRDALAANEPVAVAVPGRNLAMLRSELGSAAGQVRLFDMTEAGRNPGRIIPGVLRAFADAHPGRPVRIIGEPIWPGRSRLEYPACAQHEALINMAFAGRAATILCPYDAQRLSADVLADAEATHPTIVDGRGRRDSTAFAPDRIVHGYNQPLPEPVEHAHALEVTSAGAADLGEARRIARIRAVQAGLSAERAADVALVITELLTNSLEHGRGSGTMRLWADHDHLVCEVRDQGALTDPLAGRRPALPGQARGRGLLLVNELADLVRVHAAADGTAVQARFWL